MADREGVIARIGDGVRAFSAADWDACAGTDNPFLSHAFLSALEDSGSVGGRSGWQALPISIDDTEGRPAAVVPAYVKTHSQGEYVFDHAWADAYHRAGGDYYPKLQIAVPFTPVPGRRLLARDLTQVPALIAAAEAVVVENGLSSAHATFVDEAELDHFRRAGWLMRTDRQFHWHNDGYEDFDGFLAALASRKRKGIRKEREAAVAGLVIRQIEGRDISESDWDAFWGFYQDTGNRKWGRPYLTRRAFSLLSERMPDRILLFMAYRDRVPIAGALNFIGADTLYGRYWGATQDVPYLHFEICYYQAIDAAIARGLARVEAGAQGEHKLARGYVPVATHSAHFIARAGLRQAIAQYLEAERRAVADNIEFLGEMTPFKKG